jgi:hypothetical protein
MTPAELYNLWAPRDSIWSPWAKPVLFAEDAFLGGEPTQVEDWHNLWPAWAAKSDIGTAIILDLPGAQAIWYGMALSQRGFRPVPLYNGVAGPSPLIDVNPIRMALHEVEDALTELLANMPAEAPPVFLLDFNRSGGAVIADPGRFDNRWYVFPQDFPSANLLLSRGIRNVVLVQPQAGGPKTDLAHVLMRWQQAGIQILACGINDANQPIPITVNRPSNFRALWYLALALAGLRRNSAGGFGGGHPHARIERWIWISYAWVRYD